MQLHPRSSIMPRKWRHPIALPSSNPALRFALADAILSALCPPLLTIFLLPPFLVCSSQHRPSGVRRRRASQKGA
uniref:Uncharacterized protein n=1 Tax=Steinernema glaseri TaxID=37863 RepID=A0A1I8A527_9BILA